jgi:hypothetical protein
MAANGGDGWARYDLANARKLALPSDHQSFLPRYCSSARAKAPPLGVHHAFFGKRGFLIGMVLAARLAPSVALGICRPARTLFHELRGPHQSAKRRISVNDGISSSLPRRLEPNPCLRRRFVEGGKEFKDVYGKRRAAALVAAPISRL